MRNVVVNSTPLIVLCGINRLDILQKLYHKIIIPAAVYQEVAAKKDSACYIDSALENMVLKQAGED